MLYIKYIYVYVYIYIQIYIYFINTILKQQKVANIVQITFLPEASESKELTFPFLPDEYFSV